MAKTTDTPLMKQYHEMKMKHPDAVLLFRVGDFYETFGEDAITASEILGITLTRRANGSAKSVELAGFPHHALDTYLPKLIRAGKRVAICEQLEEPKPKELITPALLPGQTRLPNGLVIGPKIELKKSEWNDESGRFKIYNDRVGVFLLEPNHKWYFAPLILSKEDEERYRLYTEISWKYSEWIWVDEYEEEKLPQYYEELKALYNEFVSKYGFLNSPQNAEFIKLDAYSDNLEILERKIVGQNGDISYVLGKGFDEIEESVRRIIPKFDLTPLKSIVTAFATVFNILYIFEQIRLKTQEIRALAKELHISPKRAFEECNMAYYQPSLFD